MSRHDLLFGVRRSVRYHDRRVAFYERIHNVILLAALVLGSASIAAFAADFAQGWDQWLKLAPAALVSVLASIDLVVGTSAKARLHDRLKRDFINLETEMESHWGDSEEQVAQWTSRRLRIEADEPPVLRMLDTLCHNELVHAMGYPEDRQIPVGRVQRLLSPFGDFGKVPHKAG